MNEYPDEYSHHIKDLDWNAPKKEICVVITIASEN